MISDRCKHADVIGCMEAPCFRFPVRRESIQGFSNSEESLLSSCTDRCVTMATSWSRHAAVKSWFGPPHVQQGKSHLSCEFDKGDRDMPALFGSFSVPAQTVRQCVALPPVKHGFLAHIHLTTQTPTLGLDTFRHEPAGGLTHAASTQRCRDDNGHDGHVVCICGHDDGRWWWCLWWGGGGLPAWLLLDCRVSSRSAIEQRPSWNAQLIL